MIMPDTTDATSTELCVWQRLAHHAIFAMRGNFAAHTNLLDIDLDISNCVSELQKIQIL
jgi:hypothetical protein